MSLEEKYKAEAERDLPVSAREAFQVSEHAHHVYRPIHLGARSGVVFALSCIPLNVAVGSSAVESLL